MSQQEIDDKIAEWFAYGSYRVGQKEMLRGVFESVRDRKVLTLNAPTGSGKSSVVSAALAATTTRPIIVCVRTVSQLSIFVRELQKIREEKVPDLKFSYVIGRGKICRVFPEMGVNERCKQVKKFTRQMIKKDSDDYQVDIEGKKYAPLFDAAAPTFCPWYLKAKSYDEDSGTIIDSDILCEKAQKFSTEMVLVEDVKEFAGEVCPNEIMRAAAQRVDVLICNYQHILNPAIRNAMFSNIYKGDDKPVLILDEAHNAGSTLEELHSSQIDQRILEKSGRELDNPEVIEEFSKYEINIDLFTQGISYMQEFLASQDSQFKKDDIFKYEELWAGLKDLFRGPGGLFNGIDAAFHILEDYQERVENRVGSKPDEGCKNLIKLVGFLLLFSSSMFNVETEEEEHDRSIVKIFMKRDGRPALRLRSIDPSKDALELMRVHRSIILMSGTLHPPASYAKYLFGEGVPDRLSYMSLPNVFPESSRNLVVAVDVTSAFKTVTANGGKNPNNDRILGYIQEFIKLPGNLAVWYPSYFMMQEYARKLRGEGRNKNIYEEPRDAQYATRVLSEFMALPDCGKSGVLFGVCGGKFSEGIDFTGSTLVGAMVVGFPLSAYSPEQIWVINYFKGKFPKEGEFLAYVLPCLNRAMQSIGRVIRSETDRGMLVLADKRFLDNLRSLPPWMKDEAKRTVIEEFPSIIREWADGVP